ncbi:MAG: porin [Burkholderiaceae bacterium]|jgi:predicted porin|nr:porin [Burkholderiaceae bacterium]
MKKALIALAVLGAASGAAMAQSSVTLYGVADIAIGKTQAGGDHKWGAESNTNVTNGTSRIGLTGKEDLGGGLWAGFRYEGQVNLANGATDTAVGTWSREANVMLGSNQFGMVKLGRSTTPSYDGQGSYELTGWANYSVVANTYGWGGYAWPRQDAQIEYKTPSIYGLSAALAYVPKADGGLLNNQTNTGGANRSDRWDLNVIYAQGPLDVAFTLNKSNKTAISSGGTTVGTPQGNRVNYTLGGSYKFGDMFALAASWDRTNMAQSWRTGYSDPYGDNSGAGGRLYAKRYGFSLGGSVFLGAFTVTLDLTRDYKNQLYNGRKYTNGVLEGKYALSKRTFLYADYLRLDSTNNYGLGIRHNF